MRQTVVVVCAFIGFVSGWLAEPGVGAVYAAPAVQAAQGGGRGGQAGQGTVATPIPAEAPPTVATAAISGIVTDGATGQPLEGALVALTGGSSTGPRAPASARPRQRTDARGRFIFHRLPAGDAYTVAVSRQGFFDGGFRSRPGATGSRIDLKDGEWFAKADVALYKPAAITGVVRDERSQPLVGTAVRAIHEIVIGGRVRHVAGPAVFTDDRGAYRIADLRPGRYLIHVPSIQVTLPDGTSAVGLAAASTAVSTSPAIKVMRSTEAGSSDGHGLLVSGFPLVAGISATSYPGTYHPAARAVDAASVITVDYGQLRTDADVTLAAVPAVRVSGRVSGPPNVVARLPVRLIPAGSDDSGEGAETAITETDDTGQFTFLRVPAGDYVVLASTTQAGYGMSLSSPSLLPSRVGFFSASMSSGTIDAGDGLRFVTRTGPGAGAFGKATVSIGARDETDLVVPLKTGVKVSGSFTWNGSATPPPENNAGAMIRLEPADGDLAVGMPFMMGLLRAPAPALIPGTFTIETVLPCTYILSELATGPFRVDHAEFSGRDLRTAPLVVDGDKDLTGLVVHLTNKPTSVTGTVRSDAGPADTGAVVFFPANRAQWRLSGVTGAQFVTTPITASGTYRAPPLQPGEYFVVAVSNSDRARAADPVFLETVVPRAVRVQVTPGNPVTQDLRMPGGGR